MAHRLVIHRVEDYAKWRAVFDSKRDLRRENGEQTAQIFHNTDDPHNLVLLFGYHHRRYDDGKCNYSCL